METKSTEPWLTTEASLRDVLNELISVEARLHRPPPGATRKSLAAMLIEDFWEVGASGRLYGPDFVLDTLAARSQLPEGLPWMASAHHLRQLAPDTFLITYLLVQPELGGRKTRRVTAWRRSAEGWKALYHQGTVVQ